VMDELQSQAQTSKSTYLEEASGSYEATEREKHQHEALHS